VWQKRITMHWPVKLDYIFLKNNLYLYTRMRRIKTQIVLHLGIDHYQQSYRPLLHNLHHHKSSVTSLSHLIEKHRMLRDELKRRKSNGETNLVIRNNKVVMISKPCNNLAPVISIHILCLHHQLKLNLYQPDVTQSVFDS